MHGIEANVCVVRSSGARKGPGRLARGAAALTCDVELHPLEICRELTLVDHILVDDLLIDADGLDEDEADRVTARVLAQVLVDELSVL